MAKIIGEPDSIETIRHYLLSRGINDIDTLDKMREFTTNQDPIGDDTRKEAKKALEKKKGFLFGAIGEEKVINTLRTLPDTYYVLNEIHIKLTKSVLWKKYFEYVKSAQIDHVVIGETGIFLIETKNWKEMNITSIHDSPHKQIDRAGMLFWLAQKRKFGTPFRNYNLVVTLKDLPKFRYKYVYQLSIKQLNKFILSKENQLAQNQIEQIKNWLICLKVVNPRFPFRYYKSSYLFSP